MRARGVLGNLGIAVVPMRARTGGRAIDILTHDERQRLLGMASLLRLKKDSLIYREDEPADHLYYVAEGVVMNSSAGARPQPYVTSFAYPQDVIGLARVGRYLETARTVTAAFVYKLPLTRLEALLRAESQLAVHLLRKLCNELGARAQLAALLARRDAIGRAAMFIETLARRQGGKHPGQLYLSMRRADLANHLGLTAEALGRAFAELVQRRILAFRGMRHVEITDGAGLRQVIASRNRKSG